MRRLLDGRSTTLVFWCCLLAACTLPADRNEPPRPSGLTDALAQEIQPSALREQAEAIVQHQRPSGSEGENAAIDHIVGTLRADGVPVEVHEFVSYASDPVEASIQIVGSPREFPSITFSFSASVENLEAELVDVGSSSALPDFEPGMGERLSLSPPANELPRVADRVVLVEGRPSNFTTYKLELLGAAGVIFINPEEWLNDLIVTTTWGSPSLMNAHRLPGIPVAQLKKSDGEAVRTLLKAGSSRVRLSTRADTGWKTLRLPIARISPANAPEAPFVLFGGHIDAWYHGGTDEGASNAAMVELARFFHRHRSELRRGLVVAWWPGHSNARYSGSTWFSDHSFDELRRQAVAYLNVDGIGQMNARRFSATATASLAGLAQEIVSPVAGEEIRVGRPGRNSDQSFNGIGLPLLQINHTRLSEDGGYWWWHTPDDTLDKIDFDILEMDTELYGQAVARLLVAPVLPLNLEAQVENLGEALRSRQQAAGEVAGWFEEALARQADLLAQVRRLEEGLATGATRVVDLDLVQILRPIHRILYVPLSEYHPDSGIDSRPLPGLSVVRVLSEEDPESDRYRFAASILRRELNRVLEALDQALKEAQRLEQKQR